MDVHVSIAGRGDRSARIYRQLLDAVLDGRLRPGERLPSTRELALRIGVSRNTVALAYERLTAEGVVTGRVGSGTFVRAEPLRRPRPRNAPEGGVRPRELWRSPPVVPHDEPDGPDEAAWTPVYDFRAGFPDTRLFPFETWRGLLTRELRPALTRSPGYGDPAGHAHLREAIARHVGISRSVRASAADVLVTQGAQQALDLIGRVLIEPGCEVAVEDPGYPPARRLFRSLGARVTGVPVDAEGLDVSALPDSARLVYVTPSHQFPLGTAMSLGRRTALLDWAGRRGAVVIEDDYDSEFRFGGRPLEPLQSLDRDGHVVYVGSFSKTLLPMLRLGFLIAPASLRPALRTAKRLTDWHGETPTQAALARFIDEGLLARHVRRATREYAARRERILSTLGRDFSGLLEPVPSAAGLHLCAHLAPGAGTGTDRLRSRAARAGVAVDDLAPYHDAGPARPGLVIGYGSIPAERITPGLERLAESFRALRGE
ncbi:PLP-dependent aminotransferase family protein [Streptosporangium longisporum]|uniref:PLP-dependent aminotransferase family protein n=1 Tax=Streptosporangium longisporum TaxID=46187 RepID=A0ABN3XUW2_9ACTN